MDTLTESLGEEHLWGCIIAFQNYPFHTISGLPFSYTLKIGRNEEYTKELFIGRRENSKYLGEVLGGWYFRKPWRERTPYLPGRKNWLMPGGISYTFSML